jgi:hypothetical protein
MADDRPEDERPDYKVYRSRPRFLQRGDDGAVPRGDARGARGDSRSARGVGGDVGGDAGGGPRRGDDA